MENNSITFNKLMDSKEKLLDSIKQKQEELDVLEDNLIDLIKQTYTYKVSPYPKRNNPTTYRNVIRRKAFKTFGNSIFRYQAQVYCKDKFEFLKFCRLNSVEYVSFSKLCNTEKWFQFDFYDTVRIRALRLYKVITYDEFDKFIDSDNREQFLSMLLSQDDANFELFKILIKQ
jgi:hypothetical protein